MAQTQQSSQKRSGAALVELAVVVALFFLFLFGLLEYCRLVYTRQVIVNAAREGARFAVVNSLNPNIVADTQAAVRTKMCGLDTQTPYYACQVYMSDASGTSIGTAGSALFGQYMAVQIDYDYKPMLPNFLKLNSTIRITSRDLMFSEAN